MIKYQVQETGEWKALDQMQVESILPAGITSVVIKRKDGTMIATDKLKFV